MVWKRGEKKAIGDLELGEHQYNVVVQGTLLEWKPNREPLKSKIGGKRGLITSFSRQSRLRMIKLFNRMDWERIQSGIFITLTYPDEIDVSSGERLRRHRQLFWRKVETWLEHHVPAIWRVEWMPRLSGSRLGELMPHFHIYVPDEKFIPYQMINDWWSGVLHVQLVMTDVTSVWERAKAGYYICKYAAKIDDPSISLSLVHVGTKRLGHHWGKFRRKRMPMAKRKVYRLYSNAEIDAIRDECLRGAKEYNEWGTESFSFLGRNATDLDAVLADLCEGREQEIGRVEVEKSQPCENVT